MDRIIRCQPATDVRIRAEEVGAGRKAEGYAAVFDSWTVLGKGPGYEVREIIRRGAFKNALAERQDVRALWNHDPNYLLGRTKAGTLRLREDPRGLRVSIDLPDTGMGRDVAESLARGDASQMSFAFLPREGGEVTTTRRADGLEVVEVEIRDVDLYDVAIVTYPAYRDTSVELVQRSVGGRTPREAKALRVAEVRSRFRALEARSEAAAAAGGRR